MSKLRFTITMSLDGFVAGPNQSEQDPLGVGGMELHQWLVPLKAFRELHGEEGGEVSASTPVVEEWFENVGASVMGRNMFGGGPGPWGENPWNGWWGEEPPFHHPVYVLTHHAREPLELTGTTFHFVTDGIESALEQAKEAAGDKDVTLGASRLPRKWATKAILEPTATGFGDFHSTVLMFSYQAVALSGSDA
jgi:dihydrofolate reductase